MKCECEHLAHTERTARTPNGNPGHDYGQSFEADCMTKVETAYGRFNVCPDCRKDCHQDPPLVPRGLTAEREIKNLHQMNKNLMEEIARLQREMKDITGPPGPVQIEIDVKRRVLYVHIEGVTVLRVCRIVEQGIQVLIKQDKQPLDRETL